MPRPKPRRETAAQRRSRLQAAHCGACRQRLRECGCPPGEQRHVTTADLLHGDHWAGEHEGEKRELDCSFCNPRGHRSWPRPPEPGAS